MPIISTINLYVYYRPSSYLTIYLSIQKLHILAIQHSSLRLSLGTLLLFCHLIESNNTLGVCQSGDDKDKGSNRIISAVQLIFTSLRKAMILLRR